MIFAKYYPYGPLKPPFLSSDPKTYFTKTIYLG